jgi:hypothetical protein
MPAVRHGVPGDQLPAVSGHKRLVALMAAIVAAVCAALAFGITPAHAASTYYIESKGNQQQIAGNGLGHPVDAEAVPGDSYIWTNIGGTCHGGSCWQVYDYQSALCLTATAVNGEWVAEEQYCVDGDRYQDWGSPGAGPAWGYMENLGATVANIDGNGEIWYAVRDAGNEDVYVEDNTNRWPSGQTQWVLT